MAQQNSKSREDRRVREQAHRFVDLYLKIVFADEFSAGWEGQSICGKIQDFGFQLPGSSGFAGVDKMWERTLQLGTWPKQFRVAAKLMARLTEHQHNAVCIDRCYRGTKRMETDVENQRRVQVYWSDKKCAEMLGISQDTFRRRISDGYKALEGFIRPAVEKQGEEAA